MLTFSPRLPMNNKLTYGVGLLLAVLVVFATIISGLIRFRSVNSLVLASSFDGVIFKDSLSNGWSDWSWNTQVNFYNSFPSVSGRDISFTPNAWGGLYLHSTTPIDLSNFSNLSFDLRSSSSNAKLKILFYDSSNQLNNKSLDLADFGGYPSNDQFRSYSIPISKIPLKSINGLAFQENSGMGQKAFYLDNLEFNSLTQDAASVYDDNLKPEWTDWSWGSTVNFSSTRSYTGSSSISWTANQGWAGLYLHSTGFDTTPFAYLQFAVLSTKSNQNISVALYDSDSHPIKDFLPLSNYKALSVGTWTLYQIPLSDLGATSRQISGIVFQNSSNTPISEILSN